jgi:hypothetical protein
VALQRLNVPISLASAAVLAISAWTLPVYEIYKVGEDLHWKRGLNLLGSYGLECIFIPHWNNSDGGEELDTSRCYMGQDRFSQLMALLPQPGIPIIGIDERTALVLDFENDCGCVSGKGSVTVINNQHEHRFSTGKNFSLNLLGNYHIPEVSEIIAPDLQMRILTRGDRKTGIVMPDEAVMDLVEQREAARNRRDWAAADRLREEIEMAGWQLRDTPEGPDLHPKNGNSAL